VAQLAAIDRKQIFCMKASAFLAKLFRLAQLIALITEALAPTKRLPA
jgi:hypothetical protein